MDGADDFRRNTIDRISVVLIELPYALINPMHNTIICLRKEIYIYIQFPQKNKISVATSSCPCQENCCIVRICACSLCVIGPYLHIASIMLRWKMLKNVASYRPYVSRVLFSIRFSCMLQKDSLSTVLSVAPSLIIFTLVTGNRIIARSCDTTIYDVQGHLMCPHSLWYQWGEVRNMWSLARVLACILIWV